jgi:large subunit ribosomal protein L25
MRKDITIAAEPRTSRGKNAAIRLRAAGKIPAVLYGAGAPSVAVTVNPREINRILHSPTGHNTIFDLDLGSEKAPVMVVDWLHDPVKDNLLHVDFKRIDLSKRLRVKVPVHTTGEPVGVKIQGGSLEIVTREIEIECLPDEIPEQYTADITGLALGQSLRAGEIKLAEGATLTSPADMVLAHVVAIRTTDTTADAAAAAEGAVKSEPEVIKKGKKEEEGAAEDKAKKK